MSEVQPNGERMFSQDLERESVIELIDQMNPLLLALAWENFLKLIRNDVSVQEAENMLLGYIEKFSRDTSERENVPLHQDPEASVAELKKYLNKKEIISQKENIFRKRIEQVNQLLGEHFVDGDAFWEEYKTRLSYIKRDMELYKLSMRPLYEYIVKHIQSVVKLEKLEKEIRSYTEKMSKKS